MAVLTDIDWDKVEMYPTAAIDTEGCVSEITFRGMSVRAKSVLAIKLLLMGFRVFCMVLAIAVLLIFLDISKSISSGSMEPVWDIVQLNSLMVLLVGLLVAYLLLHKTIKV